MQRAGDHQQPLGRSLLRRYHAVIRALGTSPASEVQ